MRVASYSQRSLQPQILCVALPNRLAKCNNPPPVNSLMSGVARHQGGAFSTIHITPEDGFSYASVELSGYDAAAVDPAAVVAQTAAIFRPAAMSVALSVDSVVPGCGWVDGLESLPGYSSRGAAAQELPTGGRVAFHSLERDAAVADGPCGAGDRLRQMPACAAQDSGAIAEELQHVAEPAAVAGDGRALRVPSCPPTPEAEEFPPSAYSSDTDGLSSEDGDPRAPRVAVMPAAAPVHDAVLAAAVTEKLSKAAGLAAVLRSQGAVPLAVPKGLSTGSKPAAAADAALDAHIAGLVTARGLEDSFYVMDLGTVARLHAAWAAAMPRVQPFYAVKCNGEALSSS